MSELSDVDTRESALHIEEKGRGYLIFLQASLTVLVSRWIESVVVQPGLALKWLAGKTCNFSHMVMMSRAWQALRSWASPSDNTMGCHAEGTM